MVRKLMLPVLGLVLACQSDPPAAEPTPAAPAATPAPVATQVAKAAEPQVDLDSVPVEEDFEEEAETKVTSANLTSTLDELEKEIGAE